ncbi:hypothetical protein EV1_003294 [Malus domestica]
MGAPKQKWTAEEESALKAGVIKHGAGKWRTILKDPEFSGVLYTRSNVDLKDKWRNMSVMANGWGSREKAKTALRRKHLISKHDENSIPLSTTVQSDDEMMDAKPISVSSETQQISGPRKSIVRLDNLIMEAITRLKEPGGSNKTTIAAYIEDEYWPPQDFKRLLSEKLKFLTASRKLIKVKRRYRIAPTPALSEKRRNTSTYPFEGRQVASAFEGRRMASPFEGRRMASPFEGRPMVSPFEGRYMVSPKFGNDEATIMMKAQIDWELAKMRTMTPREATLAAAQAVKEAEAAIAEAEDAAREAEAAEADAEAAQAFAEAAMKTLKGRNAAKTIEAEAAVIFVFEGDFCYPPRSALPCAFRVGSFLLTRGLRAYAVIGRDDWNNIDHFLNLKTKVGFLRYADYAHRFF